VPIITTKRVYWKTAVKEMLWFLSGGTNIQELLRQNVTIWTDWPLARYRKETGDKVSQADFEARILGCDEFARKWGDLGPVYGRTWRQWSGPDGTKYDQVRMMIDALRSNPTSRRILFHAWNVPEVDNMALPPCHLLYMAHTTSSGKLNLACFQRSMDLYLGGPFNWTGGSALLLMLAQQAGLTPGELIWFIGDAHIYNNHVNQVREQISRDPRPFPSMKLISNRESIDDYRIEDFEVIGYNPHSALPAPVAV
jgi:thymidylate synthase